MHDNLEAAAGSVATVHAKHAPFIFDVLNLSKAYLSKAPSLLGWERVFHSFYSICGHDAVS